MPAWASHSKPGLRTIFFLDFWFPAHTVRISLDGHANGEQAIAAN
jgi:hypothetical protein